MMLRLLMHLAVNATDTTDICVFTLFHDNAVSDHNIVLFSVDDHSVTIIHLYRVLLKYLLARLVALNASTDQATGQCAQAAVVIREGCTCNTTNQCTLRVSGFSIDFNH